MNEMNHDLLIVHRSRAEHCETATLPGPLLREILDIALRAEYAEARLTEVLETLRDMYNLAQLLDDDDPWYGERRNAAERLAKAKAVLVGFKDDV